MNGIPIEVVVVGGGLGLVILAVILLKFGKAIARFCLTLGGLVVVVVIGLAILGQGAAQWQTAQAATQAAKAAKVAATGQTLNTLLTTACVGGLVTLVLSGLVGGGVLWLRHKLTEDQLVETLPRRKQIQQQQPTPVAPPVMYVANADEQQPFNASDWGW